MNKIPLTAALLAFASLCYAQSLPAPLNEDQLIRFFRSGDFAELEDIAAQARISKERNRAGEWQLATFYETLCGHTSALAQRSESGFLREMAKWEEEFPESVTWRIVKAKAIERLGWDARGGGWSRDVTPDGLAEVEEYMTEAWGILQDARKISTEDPALYAGFSSVALGLYDDPTKDSELHFDPLVQKAESPDAGGNAPHSTRMCDQIFDEAVAHEKLYTPFYREYVPHLLERWGGQPGELEQFADRVTALTADESGESMYARVAWGTVSWLGDDSYRLVTRFDWSRIKAGYERLLQDYPDSNYLKNQFCKMACLHKDRETAAAMLADLDRPLPNKCWMALGYFEHWSGWIAGKADYPETSPIIPPVKAHHLKTIEHLAQNGESVDVFMLGGYTPLSFAVTTQDLAMTKLLLRLGANVDVISYRGNTPVTEASRWRNTSILTALLDHGADPNQRNIEGWTGLHQAAVDGNIPTAKILLAAKADINARANNQWTPLQAAADKNQAQFIRFLLEQGADKTIATPDGRTALDIAQQSGFSDIVKLLE